MTIQCDARIYCYSDDPESRTLYRDFSALGETVPSGFKWDGASTPALGRWLIPKFHRSLKSSCLHDWLCLNATSAEARKEADHKYRIMLVEVEGVSAWRALIGYCGVRIGAWWGTGVRYPHTIRDKVWPIFGVKKNA